MALVNVFVGMAILCGGISVGSLIITKFTHMDNSNVTADAANCCALFGAVALFGLFFV